MNSILVPADFLKCSKNAIRAAVTPVKKFEGQIMALPIGGTGVN